MSSLIVAQEKGQNKSIFMKLRAFTVNKLSLRKSLENIFQKKFNPEGRKKASKRNDKQKS